MLKRKGFNKLSDKIRLIRVGIIIFEVYKC
ncbi:MAG: hypothetical protein ACJAVN_002764 [Roseivirga sp.]|jgi:hypothetical protein